MVKYLKSDVEFTPFATALALALSRIHRFEDSVFGLLKVGPFVVCSSILCVGLHKITVWKHPPPCNVDVTVEKSLTKPCRGLALALTVSGERLLPGGGAENGIAVALREHRTRDRLWWRP